MLGYIIDLQGYLPVSNELFSTFSDTITLYIKERAYFVIKKYGKLYCIDY